MSKYFDEVIKKMKNDMEKRLCDVIVEGDLNAVFNLIQSGTRVNVKNEIYGKTPLMLALDYKRTEIAILLIKAGAGETEESSLFYAVDSECDPQVIRELVDKGANVNEFVNGTTCLIYALEKKCDPELISMLLSCGSDVNVCDSTGKTPLMAISCEQCRLSKYCINKENVLLLLKHHADVGCFDLKGNSVLHLKICSCLICLFVKYGASVHALGAQKRTPLMAAVVNHNKRNHTSDIETFLSLGSDPNRPDENLNTPLHYASKPDIVHLLIYYGADINARNHENRSPLNFLLKNRYERVKSLIKHYLLIDELGIYEYLGPELTLILNSFIECCKKELARMKVMYLKDNLSLYDFCVRKKNIFSKYISLTGSEYHFCNGQMIKLFPIFYDLITFKFNYNKVEKLKFDLAKHLEGVIIESPYPSVQLNYDCLYIISHFLSFEQLGNLILASFIK